MSAPEKARTAQERLAEACAETRRLDFAGAPDVHGFALVDAEAVLAEVKALREERDAIGAALEEPCAECGHIDWRSDGYADALYVTLRKENERLREYVVAHTLVEKGVVDFDLQAEAVERLRRARDANVELVRSALAGTADGPPA